MRGAGRDLLCDDGAVGAHVGRRQPLAEREPVFRPAVLDPEVGALLIRIYELDLREEQVAVRERQLWRRAVAPPDSMMSARGVDAKRAEGLPSGSTAIEN